jgi:hypothetical protein
MMQGARDSILTDSGRPTIDAHTCHRANGDNKTNHRVANLVQKNQNSEISVIHILLSKENDHIGGRNDHETIDLTINKPLTTMTLIGSIDQQNDHVKKNDGDKTRDSQETPDHVLTIAHRITIRRMRDLEGGTTDQLGTIRLEEVAMTVDHLRITRAEDLIDNIKISHIEVTALITGCRKKRLAKEIAEHIFSGSQETTPRDNTTLIDRENSQANIKIDTRQHQSMHQISQDLLAPYQEPLEVSQQQAEMT